MADWVCYAAICRSHDPPHLLGAFPVRIEAEEYARKAGDAKVKKYLRLATAGEQTVVQECPDHRKKRR
jgi:hypothetical protein